MKLEKPIELYDFSDCEYGKRHGRYGGAAGDKDGIVFQGENWIVKFPKTTKEMSGNLRFYTTAPLSEFVGSHIYALLGYPVHETILGIRNDKIVVACKDFQKHHGDLTEIREIKNGANKQLSIYSEEELPISATGDKVNLKELELHFVHNPLLQDNSIKERFWDSVVVDIFIDNNDRNNGNWGLLIDEDADTKALAPVYDNGNAFSNKSTDEQLSKILESNDIVARMTGTRTIYEEQGHVLSSKKMLSLDNEDLKSAILRVVPKIQEAMPKIQELVCGLPREFKGLPVCSQIQKDYILKSLEIRMEHLLELAYEKVMEARENKFEKNDEEYED